MAFQYEAMPIGASQMRRVGLKLRGSVAGDAMAIERMAADSMIPEPTHEVQLCIVGLWECFSVGSADECEAERQYQERRRERGATTATGVRVVPRVQT
jgi:hypothetical protein